MTSSHVVYLTWYIDDEYTCQMIITWVGSTEVGQILRKATAGSGKKLSLELGGKSPIVVFDSADLDAAVEGVVDAVYFNQGQVCEYVGHVM